MAKTVHEIVTNIRKEHLAISPDLIHSDDEEEQIAARINNSYNLGWDDACDRFEEVFQDAMIPEVPTLISVDDRVPTEKAPVLAVDKNNVMQDLYLEDGVWHDTLANHGVHKDIVYWIPMPQLPQKQDDKSKDKKEDD